MPKTTLRVKTKNWELFNKECNASFLRRDAYLNHVLPAELDILETINPCDEVGSSWLKRNWSLGYSGDQTSSVAVNLDAPVLDRLKKVCEEKLIPRDAFFDCFLEYIKTRLYEAALVIKNPRTKTDIAFQLADVFNECNEENNDDADLRIEVMQITKKWHISRNMHSLNQDFYQAHLSIDKKKVMEWQAIMDL